MVIAIEGSVLGPFDVLHQVFIAFLLSTLQSREHYHSSPWKYLVQNTSTISSHVRIDPGFKLVYQVYAWSHKDLENSQRQRSSSAVYLTKGVNKPTYMLNNTSPFAIILCKGLQLVSLGIRLVEYPQWI